MRPDIAAAYVEFYDKGISDPNGAETALRRAKKADPANAYTEYLRASAQVQKSDFIGALKTLQEASKLPKTVQYVAVPPPGDPMQTLNRIRLIGFSTAQAASLEDRQPEYFRQVRMMGAAVIKSEPLTSLSVINGLGVVRKAYESEIAYWTKKRDPKQTAKVRKDADAWWLWSDDLRDKLAATVRDLVREAAKAAGLTDAELAQYAKGEALEDSAKLEKADEARNKLYEAEIAALRAGLSKMPDVSR